MESRSGLEVALALGAVITAAIGATTLFLTRDLRFRRRLRRLRRVAIRSLEPGQWVKLVGRVKAAGHPLEAPLTKRACVYYHVTLEEQAVVRINGVPLPKWMEAGEEEDVCDFFLTDDTGSVLVKARLGEWPTVLLGPERFEMTVEPDGQTRRREGALGDATATVIGFVTSEPNAWPASTSSAPYRAAALQLVLTGEKGSPLVITDGALA